MTGEAILPRIYPHDELTNSCSTHVDTKKIDNQFIPPFVSGTQHRTNIIRTSSALMRRARTARRVRRASRRTCVTRTVSSCWTSGSTLTLLGGFTPAGKLSHRDGDEQHLPPISPQKPTDELLKVPRATRPVHHMLHWLRSDRLV